MWFNIPGTDLNRLTKNPRYPGKPDVSSKQRNLETAKDIDDNYGVRLTTYFMVSACNEKIHAEFFKCRPILE